MIQFNLLPDIKLEYIKAKVLKQRVILISSIIAAVSLGIMLLLFVEANVAQKKRLRDLNGQISASTQQLEATQDLDKILTIQNQLNSLPALHDQKPVAFRLFAYLTQITPANVSVAKLEVDFENHNIVATGAADALSTINKYVDTLKFTTYTSDQNTEPTNAFVNVVLANFGKTTTGANFQVNMDFDPIIFDSAREVTLTVPKLITSRSETEKPGALFQPQSPEVNGGGN